MNNWIVLIYSQIFNIVGIGRCLVSKALLYWAL